MVAILQLPIYKAFSVLPLHSLTVCVRSDTKSDVYTLRKFCQVASRSNLTPENFHG